MKNTSPILNDINEYLVFVSQVKNLSENTTKSYERDLKKLYLFLEKLNITNYSDIKEEICSAWIGDLYSQNNKPKSIQRHLSSAKGFFRFSGMIPRISSFLYLGFFLHHLLALPSRLLFL